MIQFIQSRRNQQGVVLICTAVERVSGQQLIEAEFDLFVHLNDMISIGEIILQERGRDIPVDEVCFEEDVWIDWGSVVTQFFLNINDKMRLRIRIKPKTLWRTNISSVEYRGDEVHEGTVEVLLLCFIAIS